MLESGASWVAALQTWLVANATVWVLVGLVGQSLFMMRFVVQWISSEKAKQSIVPEAFWYLSLAGGLIVLAYAIHRRDPVFILGQSLGTFIYLRNIHLIFHHKRRVRAASSAKV